MLPTYILRGSREPAAALFLWRFGRGVRYQTGRTCKRGLGYSLGDTCKGAAAWAFTSALLLQLCATRAGSPHTNGGQAAAAYWGIFAGALAVYWHWGYSTYTEMSSVVSCLLGKVFWGTGVSRSSHKRKWPTDRRRSSPSIARGAQGTAAIRALQRRRKHFSIHTISVLYSQL